MNTTTIYRLVGINGDLGIVWAPTTFFADKQEAKAALDLMMRVRQKRFPSKKVERFKHHPWFVGACGEFNNVTVERLYSVLRADSCGSWFIEMDYGIASYTLRK